MRAAKLIVIAMTVACVLAQPALASRSDYFWLSSQVPQAHSADANSVRMGIAQGQSVSVCQSNQTCKCADWGMGPKAQHNIQPQTPSSWKGTQPGPGSSDFPWGF